MFADAIEYVGGFTRPVKFITRNYNTGTVLPGTATLFFVNDEGGTRASGSFSTR